MHQRIRRILASGPLALLAGCALFAGGTGSPDYDLIITGGETYDGDGRQLDGVDIAIRDGNIARIAPALSESASAKLVVDARGLVVAPGFIDPHTHADADLTSRDPHRRAIPAYAFQGVTTLVVGNDGHGFPALRNGDDFDPTGINVAVLSGFGDLRRTVIGDADRAPTETERALMADLLRRDMCAGAFGFSTGLYYSPQTYADTGEVIGLARIAGHMGGYYDTHMRDESDFSVGVLAALGEALKIGREASIPVHISHIKALGPSVWGQSGRMIERIEAARAEGQVVTADQYPWRASGTRISNALVPGWALDGGLEGLRVRLANAELRERIAQEIADNIKRRGGPDSLLVTRSLAKDGTFAGKTLLQLAEEHGVSPESFAISVLLQGDALLASFNMDAADIAAFADREWVMTGSDGSSGHPRKYGTFPKAFDDLVRKGGRDVGWFVRRSSGLTAKTVGLVDRGFLREGYAADLVIFDPAAFMPMADYAEPERLSRGVEWLVVNGRVVIRHGEYTEALPGRLLRKQAAATACS